MNAASIVKREVGSQVERHWGKATEKHAADIVREGGDVLAKSRRQAAEIARKAGNGKRPIRDRPHGPIKEGYRPHYHPFGRPGGHVFYGIAVILIPQTLDMAGRGCYTTGQLAAALGWDIASSLDPIFVTDLINYKYDLEPEFPEYLEEQASCQMETSDISQRSAFNTKC